MIQYVTFNNKTTKQEGYCLVSCSWAQKLVCMSANKPKMEACMCCVCHLEHNAKPCSAWIFLVSLFRKSLCIRTKKWKAVSTNWRQCFPMFVDAYICKCIVTIMVACSILYMIFVLWQKTSRCTGAPVYLCRPTYISRGLETKSVLDIL